MDVDRFVMDVPTSVARRMLLTGLPGVDLRERTHLDPFMKDAFEDSAGIRPVSRTLKIGSFGRLGPVDIVSSRPRLLMELKWSYELPGKVFESLWDAIKLVMLGAEHDYDKLYIATGAAAEEWAHSESRDLFATGTVDPFEMWNRPLDPKRGPNYGSTVGEDLVIGGRGNQPITGPLSITVRLLDCHPVGDDFELRLIAVEGSGERPWPQIDIAGVSGTHAEG